MLCNCRGGGRLRPRGPLGVRVDSSDFGEFENAPPKRSCAAPQRRATLPPLSHVAHTERKTVCASRPSLTDLRAAHHDKSGVRTRSSIRLMRSTDAATQPMASHTLTLSPQTKQKRRTRTASARSHTAPNPALHTTRERAAAASSSTLLSYAAAAAAARGLQGTPLSSSSSSRFPLFFCPLWSLLTAASRVARRGLRSLLLPPMLMMMAFSSDQALRFRLLDRLPSAPRPYHPGRHAAP